MAAMIRSIREQIQASYETRLRILQDETLLANLEQVAKKIITAYEQGGKVLLAGNGGSAADAQHIAAEFVNQFNFKRPGLAALALTTDSSIITAIANDYGYENIFARQLEANGDTGDVFIGISTSGNSKNVLKALVACKQQGLFSVGLTGEQGGGMAEVCDVCLTVPATSTPRIQEAHILIGHIICGVVEEALFGQGA